MRPFSAVVLASVIVAGWAVLADADDQTFSTAAKLQKPKKTSERTEGAADEVPISIWLPDCRQDLRGAIVNPFYVKAVTQEHWQEAARLWRFAIVGANYFGVRREEFGPTLAGALKEFAARSGRPEVEHLPMVFVGMSAGAGMSMHFAAAMADRVIAVAPVCLEVGPTTPETRRIPTVTIFGEKDMNQMAQLGQKLPVERAQGALWATAVQWGLGHEFAAANNLVMPFFDRVIRRRYSPDATPRTGPVRLLDVPESEGWLGDRDTWNTAWPLVAPVAEFKGDKAQACWLPDEYVARVWQAFVAKEQRVRIASPVGLGDRAPFSPHAAGATIAVNVEVADGLRPKAVELFDGNVSLGRRAVAPFEFEVQGIGPGVHAFIAVAVDADGKPCVSRPCTIIAR